MTSGGRVKLDKGSFTPLYYQIAQRLRRQIEDGALKPGHLLSEREISERFGVSRMTARQSLKQLHEEGLTYSERGRGTFVTEPRLVVHTRQLLGFTEDMKRRGLKPSSRVISFQRCAPDPEVKSQLQLEQGEEVFCICRLRLADGIPIAYESCNVRVRLCPRLKRADVERGSLYRLLENEYGVRIAWADELLESALATASEARLLSLPRVAPVLVVRRRVYAGDGSPIEVVRTVYRADRYQASIHLKRAAHPQ